MNLVLFDFGELEGLGAGEAGGVGPRAVEIELSPGDRRARHLVEVLRVGPGRTVRAGVVNGSPGRAEVLAVTAEGAVRLALTFEGPAASPPPRPPVDLLLAVPRPKALGRVLDAAAALGVGRIDLVNAWRVDKSYFDSPRLAPDRLIADLRRGLEQGGGTWLPEVAVHRRLMPVLEAPPASWTGALRLVAHPRQAAAIEERVPRGAAARVVLAIGPEGGWIERELDSLAERGFEAVTLSRAVLRVESAVTAALAELELLRRLSPG